MKTLVTLTAGALALATAASLDAQTVIRFVASNGDRNATQTAISKLLDPGWKFQGIVTPEGNTQQGGPTGPFLNSNFGTWNGTYQGQPVIIKTNYAGALAGIAAIAGNTEQRFPISDGTGTGPITTAQSEPGIADFGFSTNFQTTSPFLGVYEGVTYNPIVEEIVGVSPLGFYASPGFPAEAANLTTQLAQLLYTTGAVPLSLFTGNHDADANKIVYAIGRNTDAGQRFGAYTEVGLGTSTAARVWQPVITGERTTLNGIISGGTASSHILWPPETVSGIFSPLGSGGYSSGALLADKLTLTLGSDAYKGKYFDEDTETDQFLYPNATTGYYIGYLTPGDGNSRVLGTTGNVPEANRGVALKWNGVELTNDNVRSGRYTAWLYNRLIRRQAPDTILTGLKQTFAFALRDQIKTVDAPAGGGLFDDTTFKVRRTAEGGLVVPK